jgi:hypothetical protein
MATAPFELCGLLNLAGTDAGRAGADAAASAIDQRVYSLQIDVPAALCDVVGVADAATELRAFATNFAYSSHKTKISQYLKY